MQVLSAFVDKKYESEQCNEKKSIFRDCHVDRYSITLSSCEKTNLKIFGFISKAVYLSTFQIHVYKTYLFMNLISKKEVIFHKI